MQITASLNFDKIERTTKQIDPEKQASVSEQKVEVTPSSPGARRGVQHHREFIRELQQR